MMPLHQVPTVMLWPEETPAGTVYRPGNALANAVSRLIGKVVIQDFQLPLIEDLGFQISFPNGQPLPFPKAYQKQQPSGPRHIMDEA